MGSGNDILDTYVYESNLLLEQLESIVLEAEKADTFSQNDVNEIFRIMHTIKGSSAMMEFDSLATTAHRIEDLFFIIREKTMTVVAEPDRPALFDLLFQSIDFFRSGIEKVETGEPLNKNIDPFLKKINTFMAKIKGEPVGEEPTKAPPAVAAAPAPVAGASGAFPHELRVTFDEGCGMEHLRAFMLVTSVRDFCSETDFTFEPADVEKNPDTSAQIIENGFVLRFASESDRDQAVHVVTAAGSVQSYSIGTKEESPTVANADSEGDRKAVASAVAAAPASSAQQPPSQTVSPTNTAQHAKESLISVNLSKLDQLSAVVGEIVITESMVTASPDLKGLNLDNFTKSARQLRKLTDELQEVSMSLRMVPVSTTFQKMNRIVRDMSRKLNKRVKLSLVGENTEIDKTIVDSIGDPIMHIVRNSMDHGIEETEDVRIAAGKNPVGEITLSARDTGSEVIIEIRDDGQGVNYDSVLKKAIKNGLASPDTDYSHKEILNFLMMPGFSTNVEVTEFSGRGVGMDVVKRNVEEVGGTVSISSETGKGMTTTLTIPLTMAIMDGMEVSVGRSIFTIPINNIRSSLKVKQEDVIYDPHNGEMIRIADRFYPIIRAGELYRLPDGLTNMEDGILIWLEAGEYSYCLFVDELLGQQQVVVKQLPGFVSNYDVKGYGINGCTLLGDGSISIILDAANLYAAARNL